MERFFAKVIVTLKDEVKDNRALVLDKMLKNLNIEDNPAFSTGRFYTFSLSAQNLSDAHDKTDFICREILSNPVVEKYEINSIEAI